MADIKISQLSEAASLEGVYTIGVDKYGLSKKVSLQSVHEVVSEFPNVQQDVEVNRAGIGQLSEAMNEILTPSGSPLHDLFVAAGASYNATGQTISKTDWYGNPVSHLPGHWYLNGLGDLTNEDMVAIYDLGKWWPTSDNNGFGSGSRARTNRPSLSHENSYYKSGYSFKQAFCSMSNLEIVNLQSIATSNGANFNVKVTALDFLLQSSNKVRQIQGLLDVSQCSSSNSLWLQCSGLEEVRLFGAKAPVKMPISQNISKTSVLYIIENEAATSAITITLHASAYARLKDDADIKAALAAHTKITLASA